MNRQPGKYCRKIPTELAPDALVRVLAGLLLLGDWRPLPSFSVSFICQVQKIILLPHIPKGLMEAPAHKNNQLEAPQTEETVVAHTYTRQDESSLGEGTRICPHSKRCPHRGHTNRRASLGAQTAKNLPAMQETWV